MKKLIAAISAAALFFVTPVLAQSLADNGEDETSLSRYQIVEEGKKVLTLKELEPIEDQTKKLFAEGKCEEAVALDFSGSANQLANILRQTLEPFYDADRDDRDWIIGRSENSSLAKVERASNQLLFKRNEAWFWEAKCFFERGEKEEALSRLYRALEFIDGREQQTIWVEARRMMWEIVGFEQ